MTRTMADSVNAANLPTDVDLWGMYVNGHWPTFYQRTPPANIKRVSISVNRTTLAKVYDVEKGDLAPGNVPDALRLMPTATVYASTWNWPMVQRACLAAKIAYPPWWAAKPGYDGIYPGSVATQNKWTPGVDYSDVLDYWPGVDPLPYNLFETGAKMFLRRDPSTGRIYLQTSDGHLWWIPDATPDLEVLRTIHGKEQNLTPAFLKQFPGYIA